MRKIVMKSFWFNLSDKIRFFLIGSLNAGISYLIYSIMCIVLGSSAYQTALALAWVLSSVTSFAAQKLLVFQSRGKWFSEYLKCCTTWIFSYFINAGVLEFFVKFLHLNVFVAQIAATFIAAVFTYIIFKKFAFKQQKCVKIE